MLSHEQHYTNNNYIIFSVWNYGLAAQTAFFFYIGLEQENIKEKSGLGNKTSGGVHSLNSQDHTKNTI